MSLPHRTIGVLMAGLTATASAILPAQTKTDIHRTIYFTATSSSGGYVGDLQPADLTVVEGGQRRAIVAVEPSTMRLKVCLALDDGLSADAILRQAVFRFIQQLQWSADVALYRLGVGNAKVVDYSSDPKRFLPALNGLPWRGQGDGNLVESLYELAKDQRPLEGRRAIVVLATEIPQRSTVTADGVLEELRNDGTALYAITLAGPAGTAEIPTPDSGHLVTTEEIERDRALNEGTRQSGGLRLAALSLEGFPAALDRVRNELLNQYRLTYVVAAGSRSDGRLSLSTRRGGLTLRAPRQVPRVR